MSPKLAKVLKERFLEIMSDPDERFFFDIKDDKSSVDQSISKEQSSEQDLQDEQEYEEALENVEKRTGYRFGDGMRAVGR